MLCYLGRTFSEIAPGRGLTVSRMRRNHSTLWFINLFLFSRNRLAVISTEVLGARWHRDFWITEHERQVKSGIIPTRFRTSVCIGIAAACCSGTKVSVLKNSCSKCSHVGPTRLRFGSVKKGRIKSKKKKIGGWNNANIRGVLEHFVGQHIKKKIPIKSLRMLCLKGDFFLALQVGALRRNLRLRVGATNSRRDPLLQCW